MPLSKISNQRTLKASLWIAHKGPNYPKARSAMKNPFQSTVSDESLMEWLDQFGGHEKPTIEVLLSNFQYYDPKTVNDKLKILYGLILIKAATAEENIFFVPVGYVAKSGSAIAYFFKTQNEIPQSQFILPSDLESMIPDPKTVIVFLDDYIGSGQQARQVWDGLTSINPRLIEKAKIIFASIVGRSKGIEHLLEHSGFEVVTVDIVKEEDAPLSENSNVFPDLSERSFASAIIEKYGRKLKPDAPFGYAESQGLIGFFYSTPNNTLPIFWSTENGWKPLLPHKESFRDPSALFGPPSGLPSSGNSRIGQVALEFSELAGIEIDPQIAIKIFNEFKRLDIFLVLLPIINAVGFEYKTFSQMIELIGRLKNLTHERAAIPSSVVFVPDGYADDALGQMVFQTDGEVSLDSMEKIEAMAPIIRGSEGALVFSKCGRVRKVVLFRGVGDYDYPMIPREFHRIARASLDARALAFSFSGDGKASAFYCGKRILVYRGAAWHLQPSGIESGIVNLARRANVNADALKHVLRLAAELSSIGEGALITIGDHQSVLEIAERPSTDHMIWPELQLSTAPTETILGLMKQDGATIIDSDGVVIQGMTFLRPPVDARGTIEVGKGSKHSSACKVTSVTRCLALAVSVDGQITVYLDGGIVLKLMG